MKHCLEIIKNKKLLISIYIVLGVLLALLSAFNTSYFQKVLDDLGSKNLSMKTLCVYAFTLILICVLNYLDEYPSCKLAQSIYLDFKLRAMKKISMIDYRRYQTMGTGKLVQKIESGAAAGKSIVFDFYFKLFRELIPSIVFSLIFIAKIDDRIMIFILVGYIVIFLVTKILLKYLYKIKGRILNNEELFNKYLIRSFMELVVFRTHKRFNYEISKASNIAEEIVSSKTKMKMIHEAFFAIFELFVTIIKVVIIFIGWESGRLSIGELVALLALIDKVYSPIAIFNVLYVQCKLDRSAFRLYTDFIDMPDDIKLSSGNIINHIDGDITFNNVTFSYDDKVVFKNLSFSITAGKSVAFVGQSGCGKSTIVKQIIGLIKPDTGKIYIDGSDLSELNLNNYYDYISYTSQESPIFDGTIRENIVFDKQVNDEAIIGVLESVGLKDFYSKLQNGLDTEVGEKGIILSGGERQRLALARVYFANAKIIILDEVTSAMDNVTEELVMKNLMEFLQGRTVITIAHRLSTIKEVDEIYLFNEGELLDRGRFNELLSTNRYFKNLWNSAKGNR